MAVGGSMNILKKTSLIATITLGLTALSSQAMADCSLPTSPIIPDGNVASLDELKAAQGAFKGMQEKFFDYRDCISAKISALDTEAEGYEAAKAALTAKDDSAFEALNAVAAKLNAEIRVYKSK